jgi:hypothetical protein
VSDRTLLNDPSIYSTLSSLSLRVALDAFLISINARYDPRARLILDSSAAATPTYLFRSNLRPLSPPQIYSLRHPTPHASSKDERHPHLTPAARPACGARGRRV